MPTIEQSPCPRCGRMNTLTLERKLVADPIGTHAQAGHQLKVNARYRPVLSCDRSDCDLDIVGEYDTDGRHVTFKPPPKQEIPHGTDQ